MNDLTALIFFSLAGGLVLLMLVQGLNRTVELLSMRNLYLAGFIVYQLMNPAWVLRSEEPAMFVLTDIEGSGSVMLGYAIVYLGVFLASYHKLGLAKWAARRLKTNPVESPPATLVTIAVTITIVAVGCRFLTNLPVLRSIAFHLSIGLCVVACGLISWVWSRQRTNLVIILIGVAVFGVCSLNAVYGVFSRRALVAVGMGIGWGAYYGLGKQLSPGRLLMWSTPFVLIAFLVVSAYTGVRGKTRHQDMGVLEIAKAMTGPTLVTGMKDVLGGQVTGSASMWCIENYPPNETRFAFSLKQMAFQFVPRVWWPEKPMPLANNLAKLARIKGVNQSHITVPPGVLGYARAEGGIPALILYAIFFASLCRFFDEIIRLNSLDPYVIAACGCTTGHFLGLARGDLANFTVNVIVVFAATLFVIWVIRKLVGRPVQQQLTYWRLIPHDPRLH